MNVEPAVREDLREIRVLLEANRLPPDGIEDHLGSTLVAREAGRVVGSAAVEVYGSSAPLRSVAEDEAFRGGGLGRYLTHQTLGLASVESIECFY